jgi:hypothetical protein
LSRCCSRASSSGRGCWSDATAGRGFSLRAAGTLFRYVCNAGSRGSP